MLYNELDFTLVESLLELTCKSRGFQVVFLPKFHCELNFIEQCWGFSKWVYRQFPVSHKEDNLEHNILSVLDSIPVESIHRYVQQASKWSNLFSHYSHSLLSLGFQWDRVVSWIDIGMVSMENRQLGWPNGTVAIMFFRRASWGTWRCKDCLGCTKGYNNDFYNYYSPYTFFISLSHKKSYLGVCWTVKQSRERDIDWVDVKCRTGR
jgi:hypothetical protein